MRNCAQETYIDDVVIEEKPESVALDDADVVAAVRPRAAMDDDSDQVVQSLWVHRVVRLCKGNKRNVFDATVST